MSINPTPLWLSLVLDYISRMGDSIHQQSFLQHDIDVEATGLPQQIRCSIDRMSDNGMYILGMWTDDHKWLTYSR